MGKKHPKRPGKYIKEQRLLLHVTSSSTGRPKKVHFTVGPRRGGSKGNNAGLTETAAVPNQHVDLEHEEQPPQEDPQPPSRYSLHKQREINAWKDVRDPIFRTSLKLSGPLSNTCSICRKEHTEDMSLYRCMDCGPTATFCIECLKQQHGNSLHLPEVWKDHCFQPMLDICNFLHRVDHPSCPSSYYREVRVFDNSGRLRFVHINFCKCEPELVSLVRYGLWGASENPQTAFAVSLLEWLVILGNECHVSVEGFCNSIRWKNNLSLPEVNSLYRSLVGEPISEFRQFFYRKSTLTDLSPSLDDGTICPACPKQNGEQTILLDGNFGLVRKASSGTSIVPPHHGSRLFMEDEVVKTFLEKYKNKDQAKPDEDCNHFQAGSKIRSTNRQEKLDVSGVFGSSCRHEMPIRFLNMSRGESLGYPVLLIQQLVQQAQLKNIRLRVVYDIGCVLEAHLKRTKQQDLLDRVNLAIPIFHLYGHKTPCQILYSTRRKEGFGLTDGEGMERIWSHLRPFYRITKEMTPSHRIDLLTDAALHYARRKATDIEAALLQRMDKAGKMQGLSEENISEVVKQAPVPVTEEDMRRMYVKEQENFRQKKNQAPPAGMCKWKKDYVKTRLKHQSLQEDILATDDDTSLMTVAVHQKIEKQLMAKIENFEKSHRIRRWDIDSANFQSVLKALDQEERTNLLTEARSEASERVFLLACKARYPDGQAIAKKLSGQLQSINLKLAKTVKEYNNLEWPPQDTKFPSVIDIAEARDPYWQGYFNMDLPVGEEGDLPYSLQRKAIDAVCMKRCAQEEIGIVKEEMREVLAFLIQQVEDLQRTFIKIDNVGERAALQTKMIKLQLRLKMAVRVFRPHVSELPDLPPFLPCVANDDTYDVTVEDLVAFGSIEEQNCEEAEEDEWISLD